MTTLRRAESLQVVADDDRMLPSKGWWAVGCPESYYGYVMMDERGVMNDAMLEDAQRVMEAGVQVWA